MTAILVSATEPPTIRSLGMSSLVPEQYGCDILIGATWGLVGVQRKVFPGDLAASLADDRMARLVLKMAPLAVRILLLEGEPIWTFDGALVDDRHHLTRQGVRKFSFTLQSRYGVSTHWSDGMSDTVAFCEALAAWADKEHHDSASTRPKDELAGSWDEFILQGIEGVGPELARRIIGHFGGLPLRWSVGRDRMAEVPGIGKVRLERMGKRIPWEGSVGDVDSGQ